jgi:hypothetical protein
MDLKEMEHGIADLFHLDPNRAQWQDLVGTVMNIRVK